MATVEGLGDCQNYSSKIGEMEHKCCGGKITKYAVINCKKRGRVNAKDECKLNCPYYLKYDEMKRGPKTTNQIVDTPRAVSNVQPMSNIKNVNFDEWKSATPNDSLKASEDTPNSLERSNTVVNTSTTSGKTNRKGKDVRPPERFMARGDGPVMKNFWQQWADEISADKTLHPEDYDKDGRRKI